ncbi:MAG: hypothetical protein MJ109_01025 [Kiritimatiellae bacterium]|nr:hypothetical protein [Kiritimatiellia bacterium]
MDDKNLYGTAEGLDQRGRFSEFGSALDAAFSSLVKEENPFFDKVADLWPKLFPGLPMKPGRSDSGTVVLYVKSAPLLFVMRQHLARIKKALSSLPNAPKRLSVRLEVHQ